MKTPRFPVTLKRGSVAVRIYKLTRSDKRTLFTISWHSEGQRRTKQFAEYDDAHNEAVVKADQLNAGHVEGASMSSGDRDQLISARKIVGDVPLMAALEEWAAARKLSNGSIIPACELWAESRRSKVEQISALEASKRFLAAKRNAGVDTTAGLDRTIPKFLARFGDQLITTISAKALQIWLDESDHPVTRNTHRRRMVTFFRWAREKDFLPAASKTEIEKTDQAKESDPKKGIITAQQYAAVLRMIHATHPEYLATTVLAGFCGLRRKELHGQKWSDIALEEGHLRVTTAKNGTPENRLVTLCPAAVEWLLLCNRSKELIAPPWGIDRVRVFCRESSPPIPCPENGFRHAFVSHRYAATSNLQETAMESGNSAKMIYRHYLKLVTKAQGEAWFNIRPSSLSGEVIAFAS